MPTNEYKPLTKKICDTDGSVKVVCCHYGTEECRRIHKNLDGNCPSDCPMINIFMQQLNVFEEIYAEEEPEDNGKCQS